MKSENYDANTVFLIQGLHPESHGMIHNFIYDSIRNTSFLIGETDSHFHPYWWEDGDPIWITAARQVATSSMYKKNMYTFYYLIILYLHDHQ